MTLLDLVLGMREGVLLPRPVPDREAGHAAVCESARVLPDEPARYQGLCLPGYTIYHPEGSGLSLDLLNGGKASSLFLDREEGNFLRGAIRQHSGERFR